MEMVIKKWGNSLATRIPKSIVNSVGLELNQRAVIEAVDGKIVITPQKKRKEYSLDELLQQCSAESVQLDEKEKAWLNEPPQGEEII